MNNNQNLCIVSNQGGGSKYSSELIKRNFNLLYNVI